MSNLKFTLLCGLALAASAEAQSNVTVYGVFDIAATIETNADGNGNSLRAIGPGATGGSRLGFKGTEDLGGGLRANFKLEAGFAADTGMTNPSKFFNREAWVGLEGSFGDLRFGHQNSIMYEHYGNFDPLYGVSNVNESVPYLLYSAGNDPVHVDNAVRYGLTVEKLKLAVMAAPGEVSGSNSKGVYFGANFNYSNGPNGVGAYFEQRDPNTATTTGLGKNRVWGVGGSYLVGPVILYGNYQRHNAPFVTSLRLKGSLYSAGAIYPVTDRITLFAAAYVDGQHNDSGLAARRNTAALSAFYKLSPRTGIYAYVDTTKWRDGYVEILGDDYGSHNGRQNYYVGMRHNF